MEDPNGTDPASTDPNEGVPEGEEVIGSTMPDGAESTGIEDLEEDEITGKVTEKANADAAQDLANSQDKPQDPNALPEQEKTPEEVEGDRRARAAQVRVGQPKRKFDETIPGGKIMTRSGKLVNAHGRRIGQGGQVLGEDPGVVPPPPGGVRRLGT